MSITGFSDANQFQIVNNVVYYCNNGSSYLDKLKNGLPLDYVMELETAELGSPSSIITNNDDNALSSPPTNPEWNDDNEYIHTISVDCKPSKCGLKRKSGTKRKVKKPKSGLRVGGNDYKLFTSEQELGNKVEPEPEIVSWVKEFLDDLLETWGLNVNNDDNEPFDWDAYREFEAEWRMESDRDMYDDRYEMSFEQERDMDEMYEYGIY